MKNKSSNNKTRITQAPFNKTKTLKINIKEKETQNNESIEYIEWFKEEGNITKEEQWIILQKTFKKST